MADVKIASLTAKTTWADTDLIIVEDGADTKKMTVATLKNLLIDPSRYANVDFTLATNTNSATYALPSGFTRLNSIVLAIIAEYATSPNDIISGGFALSYYAGSYKMLGTTLQGAVARAVLYRYQ